MSGNNKSISPSAFNRQTRQADAQVVKLRVSFCDANESLAGDYLCLEAICQTQETVFHRDIQTPRRELKIRRAAEYF